MSTSWLAGQGFLAWQDDGDEVDWERTRASAAGDFVYLNLEGREPTGIVPPAAAADLTARLVDGLLSIEDPVRRSRPILIAGVKEDFEAMGAHGAGVGDIVFLCRSGYQSRNSRGELFVPTRLFHEFTSGHDHFWPLDPKIQTRLFAAGPSFREGYCHPRSEHLMDVAPTCAPCSGSSLPPSAKAERSQASCAMAPGRSPRRRS